jgi:hypothetical protein
MKPDNFEQLLRKLEAAHDVAADEIALNQRVYEITVKALGRIACEHYPAMADWQPEQLRALADKISRHASNYCLELCNLNSAADAASSNEQSVGVNSDQ